MTSEKQTFLRHSFYSFSLICCMAAPSFAHNLDTRATGIQYDRSFIALMSQRAGSNQPLVQNNDEFWMLIKTTPGPGTTVGAGGYQTFYTPPGAQVLDAAYVFPAAGDARGFSEIPIKGGAPIAIGAGPNGASSTTGLIGYTLPGSNGLGIKYDPVTAAGVARGTLAGAYADTGIFYSTNENTRFNSYGFATNAAMVNNSGDTVGEQFAQNIANSSTLGVLGYMTEWDSWQLRAYGRKDIAPIIDAADGRGNAPWGLASAVAGPQSGYAWQFNYQIYTSTVGTAAQKMQAAIQIGPWNRIQYPGSQIANDSPGLLSTTLGYVGDDASSLGVTRASLSSITNITAIRFSVGQLELGRPEFVAVKVRINEVPANLDCYQIYADAFGGDAAGADTGKDHLWRYFDPTIISLKPCTLLQKDVSKPLVAPGETFYYTITFANLGSVPLTNVTIRDTLPSGVVHVGAIPATSSNAAPVYTWNIGTMATQSMIVITQYVKATGVGTLFNTAQALSGTNVIGTAQQSVEVGSKALLAKTKSVSPSSAKAGDTVQYTIAITNIGTGINGTPMVIRDYLPTGFSYAGIVSATLNEGAITSPVITVVATNLSVPVFTVNSGIQTGKQLVIRFNATIGAGVSNTTYYNEFEVEYEGKRLPPITEAPVTIAGGKIGDLVYYDWNGNGVQDTGEQGIPGVGLGLFNSTTNTLLSSQTTDTNGNYYFTGLTASNFYVVRVTNAPAGFTISADPDSVTNGIHNVNLTNNQQYLLADFGYRPAGSGSIGDRVFSDLDSDGVFNGSDVGITNVTISLYVDTNGDGVYTPGVDAFVRQTVTDSTGTYSFTGLPTNFTYFVIATDGVGSAVDNYFTPSYASTTGGSQVKVTPANFAASGGNYLDADFGYFGLVPAAIEGTAFIDGNTNNTFQTGETVLPSVTIELYKDTNGNGIIDPDEPVYRTTTTDSFGNYAFTNLNTGNYIVKVNKTDSDIPTGYYPSWETLAVTNLLSGQTRSDNDFPFRRQLDKSVDLSAAMPGDLITYTINYSYTGCAQLDGLKIVDPVQTGLTVVQTNVGQGGVVGPYVPSLGLPGTDTITGSPTSSNLVADADAYIIGAGGAAQRLGTATNLFVWESGTLTNNRALIRFPITNIPARATLNTATVVLHNVTATGSSVVDLYRLSSNWNETTVQYTNSGFGIWNGGSWVNDDGTAQGLINPQASATIGAAGKYNWDISATAASWHDRSVSNFGIILLAQTNVFKNFASRENSVTTNRPVLAVTFTPLYDVTNSLAVSTNIARLGSSISVTMRLFSAVSLTNVYPGTLTVNGGSASVSNPVPAGPFTISAGTTSTVVYQVSLLTEGVFTFSSAPTNDTYTFPTAVSDSLLAMRQPISQVVTWQLGTNTPGERGEVTLSGYPTAIYALKGGTNSSFSRYFLSGSQAGTWRSVSNIPAPVISGGSLAYDGGSNIYLSAGNVNATGAIFRYNIITGSVTGHPGWGRSMGVGGGVLYAVSNNTAVLFGVEGINNRMYRSTAPTFATWVQAANQAKNNSIGGGITAISNFVFKVLGDSSTNIFRYSMVSNVWTLLGGIPNALNVVTSGTPITIISSNMYLAFPGGRTNFFRWNFVNNVWTNLPGPGAIGSGDGAAMTSDGVSNLYVFAGGVRTNFYRYNISSGTWTSLAGPNFGTVSSGGSLAYIQGVDEVTYGGDIAVCPTVASSGTVITVSMTLDSTVAVSNVAPTSISWVGTNSSTRVTLLSGPSPAVTNIAAGSNAVYTWTYSVNPGTNTGSIIFRSAATGTYNGASITFATNIANSVLLAPTFTFRASINNPAVTSRVHNTAFVFESGGTIDSAQTPEVDTIVGSSIGDFIWYDLNGDGIQDPDEPGISGVEVCATAGTNTFCATTGVDGRYAIEGLSSNTYTVTVNSSTFPSGYIPTTPITYTVSLSNKQNYVDADFGLVAPATAAIGDYLWIDANNDGIQDAGELPLTNVTVTLEKLIGSGTNSYWYTVTSAVTGTNGLYNFTNLVAGSYRVTVSTNSVISSPYGSSSNLLSSVTRPTYDFDGTNTPHVALVTLNTSTSVVDTVDFGYNWCSTITGNVYWDNDLNGVSDGVITNARVQVFVDADTNGILSIFAGDYFLLEVTTAADGSYAISNVPPGYYLIDVYEDSIGDGTIEVVPVTDDVLAVSPASCGTFANNDFGYYVGAKVLGTVYWDENHNAIRETTETGLSNIIVTLIGTTTNGTPVSMVATTDATGKYKFLAPEGTYTVSYNYTNLITKYPQLTDTTTPTSVDIYASPGEAGVKVIDFGVDNNGKIGDTIYGDHNTNGVQNASDPGLQDVTVYLYRDVDGDGVIDPEDPFLDVQITDSTGFYQFVGLPDTTGSVKYLVRVLTSSLPEGYQSIPTGYPVGANTNLSTFSTSLTNAQTISTVDFGYPLNPGTYYTISGTIYNDNGAGGGTKTNGVFDGTEPGITNVTVLVQIDEDNDGTNDTEYVLQTDSNGFYTVSGIPSNATVRITVQENTLPNPSYLQYGDPDGGSLSNVFTISNISANQTNLNFGYYATYGSVSGTIVIGDGDGLAQTNETPVAGIEVTLTWAGPDGIPGTEDDASYTLLTDTNGYYVFNETTITNGPLAEGLPPGFYEIRKTNPYNLYSLADADGGNPDVIQFSLGVAENAQNKDFELQLPVEIGDRVWFDYNGDGIQTNYALEDTRIMSNITVRLYDANSNVLATTVTDNTGRYRFTNLIASTYIVGFDLTPLNMSTGNLRVTNFKAQGGTNDVNDSDGRTNLIGGISYTLPFTMVAGTTNLNIDLGIAYINIKTRASLAEVSGEWRDGAGRVVWITDFESGTAGFRVYRVDPISGSETPVADDLIPSAHEMAGSAYTLIDPLAKRGKSMTYRIVEVEASGETIDLGTHAVQFADSVNSRVAAKSQQGARLRAAAAAAPVTVQSTGPSDCLKVEFQQEGMYRVSYAAIAAGMGIDVSEVSNLVASAGIELTSMGITVPYVADDAAGQILFYGSKVTSNYTRKNVVLIQRGAGVRMDRRDPLATSGADTVPFTQRFEVDNYMFDSLATPVNDWFYWQFVSGLRSTNLTIDLGGYAGGDVALKVRLIGYSQTNHHAGIALNGVDLTIVKFSGQNVVEAEMIAPASAIISGVNTVTVRGMRNDNTSAFVVDWIDASFTRTLTPPESGSLQFDAGYVASISAHGFAAPVAFSVENPAVPVWIADESGALPAKAWSVNGVGERYSVADAAAITALTPAPVACDAWFLNAANRIDYLIVVPRALESSVAELADYRSGQGLRVGVAVFEDVCDLLAGGLRTPESIRNLLIYAANTWAEAPWMVVLAGNGSFDYTGTLSAEANHLPPMLYQTEKGLASADGLLTDLNSDLLPDIAIGRLPAQTSSQISAMISKIKAYEAAHDAGWQTNMLFVADLAEASSTFGSPADFVADNTELSGIAQAVMAVSALNRSSFSVNDMRSQLIAGFNSGAGVIHYTGHGNPRAMGTAVFMRDTHTSALTNALRPVFVSFSCMIGRFESPDNYVPSIGESLMTNGLGGATAVWAPSSDSFNADAIRIGRLFYRVLLQEGSTTIGLAIQRTAQALAGDEAALRLLLNYNLLGDPALKLAAIPGGDTLRDQTFLQWRWQNFSPDQLADLSISGPVAVDASSGAANFLHYALGTRPGDQIDPAAAGVLRLGTDGGMIFEYKRRRVSQDVEYRLKISEDLFTWEESPADVNELSAEPDTDGVMEKVRARVNRPEARHLFIGREFLEK